MGIPFVYFGVEDHPDYHKATDDYEMVILIPDAPWVNRQLREVLEDILD